MRIDQAISIMSAPSEKSVTKDATESGLRQTASGSVIQGDASSVGDSVLRDFYTGAVNENYRLKSELIAKHLGEIGMGKYV